MINWHLRWFGATGPKVVSQYSSWTPFQPRCWPTKGYIWISPGIFVFYKIPWRLKNVPRLLPRSKWMKTWSSAWLIGSQYPELHSPQGLCFLCRSECWRSCLQTCGPPAGQSKPAWPPSDLLSSHEIPSYDQHAQLSTEFCKDRQIEKSITNSLM